MIHHTKPQNYVPDMQVSEGILECDWKILLVQRAEHCSAGETWCWPGGKLESWESFDEALVREIQEETGIDISENETEGLFTKYFDFIGKKIEIRFYRILFLSEPKVTLNSEHQDYKWVDPSTALTMNLNEDFDKILKEIYHL